MMGHYGIAIVEPNNKKFVGHNISSSVGGIFIDRRRLFARPGRAGLYHQYVRFLFVIGGARHLRRGLAA